MNLQQGESYDITTKVPTVLGTDWKKFKVSASNVNFEIATALGFSDVVITHSNVLTELSSDNDMERDVSKLSFVVGEMDGKKAILAVEWIEDSTLSDNKNFKLNFFDVTVNEREQLLRYINKLGLQNKMEIVD